MRQARAASLLAVLVGCTPGENATRPDAAADAAPPRAVTIPHHADFADTVRPTVRQVVYVPVYTDIYIRDERRRFPLTVTLSVRNTDPEHSVTISAVQLYGTAGDLVREYLKQPRQLGPLATAEYIIPEQDQPNGSGANFLVEWAAQQHVTDPVIEAVMVSGAGTLGISFVSVGRPLVRR